MGLAPSLRTTCGVNGEEEGLRDLEELLLLEVLLLLLLLLAPLLELPFKEY